MEGKALFREYFLIAGILAVGVVPLWPQAIDQQPTSRNPVMIHSAREFKEVSKRAQTAEEYGALSAWCSNRSSTYGKKIAELESELTAYYARSGPVGPKYPPRDQTLKELIAHYRLLSSKWQDRATGYTQRATNLKPADGTAEKR